MHARRARPRELVLGTIHRLRRQVLMHIFRLFWPPFPYASVNIVLKVSKKWHFPAPTTHCVVLKHYYSVDFPWWFDRKIGFFSFLRKVVKWQTLKAALCYLTKKLVSLVFSAKLVKWQNVKLHFVIWQKNCLFLTLLDDQIFRSFWKSNPWMNLLEKKILLYQFLF